MKFEYGKEYKCEKYEGGYHNSSDTYKYWNEFIKKYSKKNNNGEIINNFTAPIEMKMFNTKNSSLEFNIAYDMGTLCALNLTAFVLFVEYKLTEKEIDYLKDILNKIKNREGKFRDGGFLYFAPHVFLKDNDIFFILPTPTQFICGSEEDPPKSIWEPCNFISSDKTIKITNNVKSVYGDSGLPIATQKFFKISQEDFLMDRFYNVNVEIS